MVGVMDLDLSMFGYKLLPLWTRRSSNKEITFLLLFWQSCTIGVFLMLSGYYWMLKRRFGVKTKTDTKNNEIIFV